MKSKTLQERADKAELDAKKLLRKQKQNSYSEEEVINLLYIRSMCQEHYDSDAEIREWFNKFKKK